MSTVNPAKKRKRDVEATEGVDEAVPSQQGKRQRRRGRRRKEPDEGQPETLLKGEQVLINGDLQNGVASSLPSLGEYPTRLPSNAKAPSSPAPVRLAEQVVPESGGQKHSSAPQQYGKKQRRREKKTARDAQELATSSPRPSDVVNGNSTKTSLASRITVPWKVSQAMGGRLLDADPIFTDDEQYAANPLSLFSHVYSLRPLN